MSGEAAGLAVRGGPGGVSAWLDDLEASARRLHAAAGTMASIAARVARIAADPGAAVTALASPFTWFPAERHLTEALVGRSGALVVAARYEGVAAGAAAALALYRGAEDAASLAVHRAAATAGRVAGAGAPLPVLAGVALVGVATARRSGGGAAGRVLADLVATHPDAVEHAVDAAPGVLGGLRSSPLLWLLSTAVTRRPGVPLDVPGAASWVGSLGRVTPFLREGTAVTVRSGPPVAVPPPRGLGDLVGGVGDLDPQRGAPPGTVRVVRLVHPDGRRAWVVQIPGTQTWSPLTGTDPLDLSGDVHTLAGEPTAARRLVGAALAGAGARPGEPVALVGHSQGGMVAAQLAADPAFRARFRVTHVVTAGSPIATARLPDDVSVLSLEHAHDLVPRLDGAPNPDRAHWITVTAPVEGAGGAVDVVREHDLAGYARTAAAVDASADPGLRRWRAGLAPFLAGAGVGAEQVLVTGERAG